MKQIVKKLRQRAGVTLVELIVCFALLGIFLVAVSACLAPAMRVYQRSQQQNQAQSVADSVLQTARAALQTMQGTSGGDAAAYVKLRNAYISDQSYQTDGRTVAFDADGMSGNTVEFLCPVQTENGSAAFALTGTFLSQLDAKGLGQWNALQTYKLRIIDGVEQRVLCAAEDYPTGYVIQRFYRQSTDAPLFYDYDETDRVGVLYDLQQVYAKEHYMGYTLGPDGCGLVFTIPADALETVDGVTKVKYVTVSVTLYRGERAAYTATTAVRLVNKPIYQSAATTVWEQNNP